MLVISNQPRASSSSDFEITWKVTPWIVLLSVQLLLLKRFTIEGFGGKRMEGFLLKIELCQKRSKFRKNVLYVL